MTKSNSGGLLIGVDVGGTNTDSVLLDPSSLATAGAGVLASHKSPTTPDVSVGIIDAIKELFNQAPNISQNDIACVTIGTTHFINAVIERDQNRLVPVAVLRLCGPYSVHTPPFCDFPPSLAKILHGHHAFLNGGFKVDGALVKDVDEQEVVEQCHLIKKKGIKSIVVIGNFSPMDNTQELLVEGIINRELPDVAVVKSFEVANIGFLERENAAILNAAILPFAKKIVSSFEVAVKSLGINCPLVLTQNDGTVLPAKQAAQVPIRSFSSGATNSMRGAAFLCSNDPELKGKNLIVMDIGGTTTDVGMLMANGFPRQAATYSTVGGVRMNFPMPYVESVGFGGGSIVRYSAGNLTIGPDSVGSEILTKGLVFGGSIATATDAKLAAKLLKGDKSLFEESHLPVKSTGILRSHFDEQYAEKFEAKAKDILEAALDRIKTSPEDIPVLLVGGGSILAPDSLVGAAKVVRPQHFGIANAIGAAISKVSAIIDNIGETSLELSIDQLRERNCQKAVDACVMSGALRSSVEIAEVDIVPLPYVLNRVRMIVKAVGDMDYDRVMAEADSFFSANQEVIGGGEIHKNTAANGDTVKVEDGTSIMSTIDVETYKPKITSNREWIISEVDLEFIALGAYILGAGGGGSPYSLFLRMREFVRNGVEIKVVDINELVQKNKDAGVDGRIITISGAGSPTVSVEQIDGKELEDAYDLFKKYVAGDDPPQAVMSIEIGGSNGIQPMRLSATKGLLCVDADLMGRAYPTLWQTTPTLFNKHAVLCPAAISDGNGNGGIFFQAEDTLTLEKMRRSSLSQIGSRVGTVNGIVRLEDMAKWCITNTTSWAWRIGRAVMLARQQNNIENIPQVIIDAAGGPECGLLAFTGKVIGVDRRLEGGYSVGNVTLQSLTEFSPSGKPMKLRVPFKNENISAELINPDTGEVEIIASVPDLICVIDTQNGANIGNPEFKYGITVYVLIIACSPKWSGTPEGIALGGPKAFKVDIEYKPAVYYKEPRSVIEEYA